MKLFLTENLDKWSICKSHATGSYVMSLQIVTVKSYELHQCDHRLLGQTIERGQFHCGTVVK